MGERYLVSFICYPSLLQVSIQMEHKVWGSCKHGLRMSEFYAWRKSHFSWFTQSSKHSEVQGVPLPQPSWSFLVWRSLKALALRGRALDLNLSFNQVGHVVKGAFLAVLLYFFVWPQVTHRITMEQGNISIDGRKRGQWNFLCISKGLWLGKFLFWCSSNLCQLTFSVDVLWQVGGRYLL